MTKAVSFSVDNSLNGRFENEKNIKELFIILTGSTYRSRKYNRNLGTILSYIERIRDGIEEN